MRLLRREFIQAFSRDYVHGRGRTGGMEEPSLGRMLSLSLRAGYCRVPKPIAERFRVVAVGDEQEIAGVDRES